MSATDQMIARLQAELEERKAFQDQLVEGAQEKNRDLNENEMELYNRAAERMTALESQLNPLREGARIAVESGRRTAELQEQFAVARNPKLLPERVEFRSIGAYVAEVWKSGAGSHEAQQRLELYHRAAAHQITSDNPGLLPESILGPVLSFVDGARPVVSALGPKQLPSGSWSRPRISQHTSVGKQTAQKTELPSQKMIIDKIPVTADTFGGYVNVSRQNVDWTQPAIMDLVINDLALQYALQTELEACTDFTSAATAGPVLPATPTAADVAAALWEAAGTVYSAMQGVGGLLLAVAPDMLGLVGPLFAPVNPQNAQSTGFAAGSFGSGAMGAISGIRVVMSAQLADGTALVISTAAAEIYEDRIGSLQVVEPSVLGIQVAYAGYFADLILDAAGIVKITKTVGP